MACGVASTTVLGHGSYLNAGATIGVGAVVTRHVADFEVVVGNRPAPYRTRR